MRERFWRANTDANNGKQSKAPDGEFLKHEAVAHTQGKGTPDLGLTWRRSRGGQVPQLDSKCLRGKDSGSYCPSLSCFQRFFPTAAPHPEIL